MRRYVAQFATTTDDKMVRVWAWAMREVGNPDYYERGTDIIDFMDLVSQPDNNGRVYVHNLKFYGQFIIFFLMEAGFTYVLDEEDLCDLSFTTLMSSQGDIFRIEIYFKYEKKEGNKKAKMNRIVLMDSLKLINVTIPEINRDFGLNIDLKNIPEKVDPDYDIDYQPTEEEWEAINSNLEVVLKGVEHAIDMGLTGLTIGACALSSFKYGMRHSEFIKLFPVLEHEIDDQIRKAYRGGYCYLNPKYYNSEVGAGVTIDKNSMYPSKMCGGNWIPFGRPEYFEGQYQEDKYYPLYIQTIKCRFWLKPGYLPCVQVRSAYNFIPTMWQETSDGEIVVMTLTSVDLKLFLKNYHVKDLEYIDGWKFRAGKGMFNRYVKKWANRKAKSKIEGNKSEYELSKRLLNSLYGKLSTNTRLINSYPVFDKDKCVVGYNLGEPKLIDPVYTAAGAFITSYARADIIETAENIRRYSMKKYGEDRFVYIDTDSVKCLLTKQDIYELADMGLIKLHDNMIGAYKIEDEFERAKFIKPKCYLQIFADNTKKVCVAGLPKKVGSNMLDWDTFKVGWTTETLTPEEKKEVGCKTIYKLVRGGCILETEDYSILP